MSAYPFESYGQVFVIMRVTPPAAADRLPESAVALVKALWSAAEAEAEVERLNRSKHDDGSVYFWKATRLDRKVAATGAS
jgi:hypothetical protein